MKVQMIHIFILLIANFQLARGWWDTGHLLTAKIAEHTLDKESKESLELARNLAGVFNTFSHGIITNFAEAACWADDVIAHGLAPTAEWHYIDIPIRYNQTMENNQKVQYTPHDALGLLNLGYKALTQWKKEEVENLNVMFEKAMLMRYLIHVIGDVHMPLHASALFNERFPNGDYGGNLFVINYKPGLNNLHKFFDSGADQLRNDIKRPLSQEGAAYISSFAQEIMKEYPKESLAKEMEDHKEFDSWVIESNEISRDFIYKEIEYGGVPSESYKSKAFAIIKKRIALGGYRLASVVKMIKEAYDKPLQWDCPY